MLDIVSFNAGIKALLFRGKKRKGWGLGPYIMYHFKIQPKCHIDKEILFGNQVHVFLGKMEDEEEKSFMFTMVPKKIMRVHMHDDFEQSHKAGFDVP